MKLSFCHVWDASQEESNLGQGERLFHWEDNPNLNSEYPNSIPNLSGGQMEVLTQTSSMVDVPAMFVWLPEGIYIYHTYYIHIYIYIMSVY